jgi:hypothetical protein
MQHNYQENLEHVLLNLKDKVCSPVACYVFKFDFIIVILSSMPYLPQINSPNLTFQLIRDSLSLLNLRTGQIDHWAILLTVSCSPDLITSRLVVFRFVISIPTL